MSFFVKTNSHFLMSSWVNPNRCIQDSSSFLCFMENVPLFENSRNQILVFPPLIIVEADLILLLVTSDLLISLLLFMIYPFLPFIPANWIVSLQMVLEASPCKFDASPHEPFLPPLSRLHE